MAEARSLLIGRLAAPPHAITTPSGVSVTMLTLTVCDDTYELVTFGTDAERAARLAVGQAVIAEGRWQVREEGRRELAVSSLQSLAPFRPAEPSR